MITLVTTTVTNKPKILMQLVHRKAQPKEEGKVIFTQLNNSSNKIK